MSMDRRLAALVLLAAAVPALAAPRPLAGQTADTAPSTDPDPAAQDAPVECVDGKPITLGAEDVPWADTAAALTRLSREGGGDDPDGASPDRLLARGDSAFAVGHHTLAYTAYSTAARAAPGYEASWKSARAAIDVGQGLDDDPEPWYRLGESWGREAAEREPDAPEGHFMLAQALGLIALDAGVRERVQMSTEIRSEALAALEADSSYAGGWHILGRWHAGVRELSGPARFFARTFLGGEVFSEASWDEAERHLRRAGELEPDRIVHPLELARVYLETDRPEEARSALERALTLTPMDGQDCAYLAEARRLLEEELGGGPDS
ncbi:MAG: tetratricopeptide repeat protein [Gemmatimonadota bacterium]